MEAVVTGTESDGGRGNSLHIVKDTSQRGDEMRDEEMKRISASNPLKDDSTNPRCWRRCGGVHNWGTTAEERNSKSNERILLSKEFEFCGWILLQRCRIAIGDQAAN